MMNSFEVQRILIIKLSALGDIIMTLPLLAALKEAFPNAEIDWLVNKSFQDILKGQKDLQQILPFQRTEWGRKNFWKNRKTFFQLLQNLRNRHYEIVLDFQGLFRSGFSILYPISHSSWISKCSRIRSIILHKKNSGSGSRSSCL